jgi:KDO2-lipid IV(A) lauroyltransferase
MKPPKFFLMTFASVLLNAIPFELTRIIARVAGFFYYLIDKNRRRTLVTNFRYLLDSENQNSRTINRVALRTLSNLCCYIIDALQIPNFSRSWLLKMVEAQGTEFLDQALAQGRGVILVSAHLGAGELASAYLARRGYPVVLVSEEVGAGHTETLGFYRRRAGVEVIMMTEPVRMLKTLKRNKILLVAGDRDLTGTGVVLPFFNGRRSIPRGPALFAVKTGAPVLVGCFVLNPISGAAPYLGLLDHPVEYRPTGDPNGNIDNLTTTITERLQRFIKLYPDQWYVFQPDWR